MKYCTKCGNELYDEAVICPKCGCAVEGTNLYRSQSDGKSTLKLLTKIFMMLGCVMSAFLCLIPLCWTIPMTLNYLRKSKNGEPISTTFKVCTLIFVSLVAGILMLCDEDLTD